MLIKIHSLPLFNTDSNKQKPVVRMTIYWSEHLKVNMERVLLTLIQGDRAVKADVFKLAWRHKRSALRHTHRRLLVQLSTSDRQTIEFVHQIQPMLFSILYRPEVIVYSCWRWHKGLELWQALFLSSLHDTRILMDTASLLCCCRVWVMADTISLSGWTHWLLTDRSVPSQNRHVHACWCWHKRMIPSQTDIYMLVDADTRG